MASHFDNMRFSFEYGGKTVQELCAESGYLIKDVEAYAASAGWKQQFLPDAATPEQIHAFYTTARRKLSVTATQRAMSIYSRLTSIEDALLSAVEEALIDSVQSAASASLPGLGRKVLDGLELSRLVKVVETLQTNNRIYAEAFGILAQNDPDRVIDELGVIEGDETWTFEVVHTDKPSSIDEGS